MSKTLTEVKPSPINSLSPFLTILKGETGMLLLLCLALVAIRPMLGGQKQRLANAKFGGRWSRWSALRIGRRQLKEKRFSRTTLYAGSFKSLGLLAELKTLLLNSSPTLIFPNIQQGLFGFGAPNSGKTFSLSDPLIRAAIEQGKTIIVFDGKVGQDGNQLQANAALAAANGYEVHVYAPGYPFSCVINPLDFIRDADDALMARQLAEVINLNSRSGKHSKDNDFFVSAGNQLVEAILLLAKTTAYPDLLMCKQLLALSELPSRLRLAKEEGRLKYWHADGFSQFLASEAAAPTSGGISATAARVFDTFNKKQLASSFLGTSTIPLDIKGKQIIFIGTDLEKETVVLPILASVLHLLITRNFSYPRSDSVVLSIDEFATFNFPHMKRWVNKLRSMGLVPLLFCQNQAQIRSVYGQDEADEIVSAFGTTVYFNPKHFPTAKAISDYLGDIEVCIEQESRSRGKGGSSTSTSKHYQVRPLKAASEIVLMDEGEAIIINSAHKEGGKASLPLYERRIRIPKHDVSLKERSEHLWHTKLCPRLTQRVSQFHLDSDALDQALEDRRKTAELLLPLPDEKKGGKSGKAPLQTHKDEYEELFRS